MNLFKKTIARNKRTISSSERPNIMSAIAFPIPQEVFDWIVNEYRLDGRGRLLDGDTTSNIFTGNWFSELERLWR